MEAWRLVCAALAAWRVTQFVVLDDGPFDMTLAWRARLGRYQYAFGEDGVLEPATALGRWLECAHCVGKWVAIPLALLVVFPTTAGDVALVIFALSGAQSLLEGRRSCHDAAVRDRRNARKGGVNDGA